MLLTLADTVGLKCMDSDRHYPEGSGQQLWRQCRISRSILVQVWTLLCFHPPSIPGHRNGTLKTNSRNSREASTAQGSSPQCTPLCSGGFLSCMLLSFPTDIQAHRHYDQVICSPNPGSFASLIVFWFFLRVLTFWVFRISLTFGVLECILTL